jgi:hypothetical protein
MIGAVATSALAFHFSVYLLMPTLPTRRSRRAVPDAPFPTRRSRRALPDATIALRAE